MNDPLAHVCSVRIACPAMTAMAFLSAPEKLSLWAVGMGETCIHPDGLVEGAFPDSGAPIWARIDADPGHGTIHYHLGPGPGALVPRIMIRVVPAQVLNSVDACCVVSMIAWRQDDMDDARWQSLCSGHENEIVAVKRLIEAAVSPRASDRLQEQDHAGEQQQ